MVEYFTHYNFVKVFIKLIKFKNYFLDSCNLKYNFINSLKKNRIMKLELS